MPTCYIRATKDNLKEGNIVISITDTGSTYGPLMICTSLTKHIRQTGVVNCSIHNKNGLLKTKRISVNKLARVYDHAITRKIKPEERFD